MQAVLNYQNEFNSNKRVAKFEDFFYRPNFIINYMKKLKTKVFFKDL